MLRNTNSVDHERIRYHRLLNSFARELKTGEVKQIAFIYCKEDAADFITKESALDLLLKLERLAIFSFEDPSGLIQVAEDVGYFNWVKKVGDYVETRRRAAVAPSSPKPTVKKRTKGLMPIPSEERKHLEEVHDTIVKKCMHFEEEFQDTWKRPTVSREEGLTLLRKGEKIVQEMQTSLKKGTKKLNRLSRPYSGSSSDSSSGSESSVTSPVDATLNVACELKPCDSQCLYMEWTGLLLMPCDLRDLTPSNAFINRRFGPL